MDISQTLSVESFSYRWLVNTMPALESLEESIETSFDDSYETFSFIEMDPKVSASGRFSAGSRDFNFNCPISESTLGLVHADELISNGFLVPLFAIPKKIKPYDDSTCSTPPTPVFSHAHKNTGSDNKVRCSSFKTCQKFSKRILRKYMKLITHILEKFEGRRSCCESEANGKKQEDNRFTFSATASPQISVGYSVDYWQRSSRYESSIHEAVLYCKRSIGK